MKSINHDHDDCAPEKGCQETCCGKNCCDGDHDDHLADDFEDEPVITMVDTESGEEFEFVLADDFVFEDNHYCVLVTLDDESPEWVITKVTEDEDGQEALLSLDEDEYDAVYEEYDRLCSECQDEDEESED